MEDGWLSVDVIRDYLRNKQDIGCKWICEKGMSAHKISSLLNFSSDDLMFWACDSKTEDFNVGDSQ